MMQSFDEFRGLRCKAQRVRCIKFHVMNVTLRCVKSFSGPPQADAGWIGEAGPGPSYLDEGSGGPENDFTQRNVTFMTWNLMHLTR